MPDTLSQTLRDWQTFYFLIGGAAAGLVGLTFVAITVGSGIIIKQNTPALRAFVNPSLIHFIYVLVTAAVVVIPTITRIQLGILLALAGLVSAGRALAVLPFMVRQYREHIVDLHDWAWYFLAPLVSYLMYVGTGMGLLLRTAQVLDAMAWACILLLVAGIRNTWDMVLYMMFNRQEPPKP
ncbi:MAG: hypothetical protein E6H00_11680 [Bacillati bacterium ANGP1]|uniref:Uncharacterized protein n=1 Tax=Candidatus Segetimicrobium genomatis TaxID=2569760 RepID=A0A537JZ63_9BACT|nr:MAG: hypothetical protein E6H00_11680 [Terrabacteria group bacterium ANGP1]